MTRLSDPIDFLALSRLGLGSAFAVQLNSGNAAENTIQRGRSMQTMADRLGDGVLNIIEQVIPSAAHFEDYSVLIGQCLLVAFALMVVWSVSGLVRR
jgi:hypothetical protein